MSWPVRNKHKQAGAALIIVLLLVATLSVVALGITETTTIASIRTVNERARSESLWRAFGAETLGASAIQAAVAAKPASMALDDPWLTDPLVVPMEDGAARLFFSDANRCFNVNSLVQDGARSPTASNEFVRLMQSVGYSAAEGERTAEVISDWIDADNARGPQGAEDDYYSALDQPYRTGGTLIADLSELRAMRGVTRELYAALKPFLCAHPQSAASGINVNMLRVEDAPLLAAVLGDDVTVPIAADLIAARPPGGYVDIQDFWTQAPLETLSFDETVKSRIKLTSQYVHARVEIAYDTAFLEMTTIYDLTQGGRSQVVRRRLGASE